MIKPYCQITGTGPALVLIHGWGLHGGIWQTVLPKLEENFTVYNIDLPGFGHSAVYNGEYHLDYLVESVESVLPKEQNYYLMGWSLGGLVASQLAINFSLNNIKQLDVLAPSRLITVASSPCFVANDNWQHAMSQDVLKSFMDFLKEDYETTLIRFLSIQTMGSITQKEDIKQLKEAVFVHGQPAQKALAGGLQILQDVNLLNNLANLNMPLLRLYGRLDSLVPVKMVEAIDKLLPDSRSIIYDKAAHAPFMSASEKFIDDITGFFLPQKNKDIVHDA